MFYKTILCATDGLEHSDRALEHAAEVAENAAGELHVVFIPERPLSSGVLTGEYLHVTPAERQARIRTQTAQVTRGKSVHVTQHLLPEGHGSVAGQIAKLADEVEADVIIVGTRGHSALAGALVGSVSQRLPQVTTRPILIVAGQRTGRKRLVRRDGNVATAASGTGRR